MSQAIDATFSALAAPARRAIIERLLDGPMSPSGLADALMLNRPALSKHLGVLRRAGLVRLRTSEGDARVRAVELQQAPFAELRTWLEEVEGFWSDQLQAFKVHAESKHRDEAP